MDTVVAVAVYVGDHLGGEVGKKVGRGVGGEVWSPDRPLGPVHVQRSSHVDRHPRDGGDG